MAFLAGWSKRQKLTIDHTQVDDELTDFPVKVIVPNTNPLFNTAKSDGADVRFTAADGETLLKFEREVHDTTEKIAVYHVKIPSVSSTSDTDFYLYYGNAFASDASTPNDVWDSYYKLVMHMGPDLKDSTSNGNDGTNYGSTLGLASDGYYRSFDGVDDYINISNPTGIPVGGNAFTKEIYYSLPDYTGSERYTFIGWGSASTGKANVTRTAGWADNIGEGYAHYFWRSDTLVRQTINENIQYYLTVTFDGLSTLDILHNGSSIQITTATPNVSSTDVTIGKSVPAGGEYLKGTIYEVRISSVARSDAWIKATSASLHNNLLTFGSEESAPPPIQGVHQGVQIIFI